MVFDAGSTSFFPSVSHYALNHCSLDVLSRHATDKSFNSPEIDEPCSTSGAA